MQQNQITHHIPHQVPIYMMQKLLTRRMLRYWNIAKQSDSLMKQNIDGFWMIYLLQLISTIVILFELISHSIISDSDEGITIEYDEVDAESSIELQQEIINVSVDVSQNSEAQAVILIATLSLITDPIVTSDDTVVTTVIMQLQLLELAMVQIQMIQVVLQQLL